MCYDGHLQLAISIQIIQLVNFVTGNIDLQIFIILVAGTCRIAF